MTKLQWLDKQCDKLARLIGRLLAYFVMICVGVGASVIGKAIFAYLTGNPQ